MSAATERLAQLESIDADGRVAQAWDVRAWPLRVGRALDNDVVLHDPHVAAHHARVELDDEGRAVLVLGESRNGARVEEGAATLTLAAGQRALLAPLAQWHLGATVLRLRRAQDPLPEEMPLMATSRQRLARKPLVALAGALMAWVAATLWLENNPASTWEAYLPPFLGVAGALVAWAALWGLASKLFTRRFTMLPHLRVVLMYALAIAVAEATLGLVAYAVDWPWASRIRDTMGWLLAAAMLAHHLRLVVPAHPRRINAVVGGLAVSALAWVMALQWQRNDRLFDELYLATLPPPAWRLAPAQPTQALIDDLRALEAPLRESARKAAEKDTEL
jgi:FHA domain